MKLYIVILAAVIFIIYPYAHTDHKTVVIKEVPHVKQKPDFCGEACAEMYLRKLNKGMDQDYVFARSNLNPTLGRGCYTSELARALKNIGFKVGDIWYKIAAKNHIKEMRQQWQTLYKDLQQGTPSIVCMHYSDRPNTTEHFRLILGYDARTDEMIYHEPAEEDGKYRRMKRKMFIKLWPLKYKSHQWTVVRLPLKVGTIEEVQEEKNSFSKADYAQHIRKLKNKIPNPQKDFKILVEHPFVVIGDESLWRVQARTERTIRWAVNHLKKDYFAKDPNHIIDIWLFKNKSSYRGNTYKIFGDRPSTPFGYYSYRHKALIMNISTGGGTLVHEIVHPFMASNFPDCPSWFNEGLASLYEQCGTRNGHIYGYTNWRLKGLQKAIKKDEVPSFKTLTSTTRDEFYDEDPGTNYSQARYLCYYLQEKDLLVKFYHQFRKNYRLDPTGYKTLKAVLGEKDMDDFKKRWQKFVLRLEFR